MKIIQTVTLYDNRGAFGGPLRVAINQVRELVADGHDVELIAGRRRSGRRVEHIEEVSLRTFRAYQLVPGAGFSGLFSPGMTVHLLRRVRSADVVHIHAGRDLISLVVLLACRLLKTPYITQTHGMIVPKKRFLSRTVDRLAVKPLISRAHCNLVLTDEEGEAIRNLLESDRSVQKLGNGIRVPPLSWRPSPGVPEVVFCARLAPRKRADVFVKVSKEVKERGLNVRFAVIGPDGGSLEEVRDLIRRERVDDCCRYEGALPYADVLSRLAQASIYVLPSVAEPFPMSLLEALSLGVPSVCTESTGISDLLQTEGAALVTDGSVASLSNAVVRLLQHDGLRDELGSRGRRLAEERFSIRSVVKELETLYQAAAACWTTV